MEILRYIGPALGSRVRCSGLCKLEPEMARRLVIQGLEMIALGMMGDDGMGDVSTAGEANAAKCDGPRRDTPGLFGVIVDETRIVDDSRTGETAGRAASKKLGSVGEFWRERRRGRLGWTRTRGSEEEVEIASCDEDREMYGERSRRIEATTVESPSTSCPACVPFG